MRIRVVFIRDQLCLIAQPLPSAYPAPILESDSELLRNCVGGRLGSPLEFIPAARLAINFHPAADNQAYRIAASDRHGGGYDHPGGFASGIRSRTSRSTDGRPT